MQLSLGLSTARASLSFGVVVYPVNRKGRVCTYDSIKTPAECDS